MKLPRQQTGLTRELRRNQTTAEAVLWQRLRARQLADLKWRRQQQFGPYVVDFYCRQLFCVVEVDGDVHAERVSEDAARQIYLESFGLQVLRFSNEDVFKNLDGVLETILEFAEKRKPPSP